MFVDVQDELVSYLQSQVAEGQHLETINAVLFSDAPPPAQYHRAVTVDWDNEIDFRVTESGVVATTRFAVTTYIHSPEGEKAADRILQDVLMRRVSDKWRGVLPALAIATGITTDAAAYFLKVLPNIVRGVVSNEKQRVFRAAAVILVEATTIIPITEFVITP